MLPGGEVRGAEGAGVTDLQRILGEDALRALAAAHGGEHIPVPKGISPESSEWFRRLTSTIGADLAAALVKECGGTRVYVPTERYLSLPERDARAREMASAGASRQEIAAELGVNRRTVINILRVTETAYGIARRR